MINVNLGFTSMVLRLQTGMSEGGTPQYKDKSYPRVMPTATQEDLYLVGEQLASLSSYRLHHIQRLDREDLVRIP